MKRVLPALCALAIAAVGVAAFTQPAADKKKDPAPPAAAVALKLPRHFDKLDLSKEQLEKIDKIRKTINDEVQEIENTIRGIRVSFNPKCRQVLTLEQADKLLKLEDSENNQ
jgi:Spy/CpxP family protein refolding chaperone